MKVNSLQEYKDFVERHNIPLDTIRFALGEDKGHDPRWFYIYQDRFTGEWVVVKNKSDGSTAERYRGNDEAKACQILFDKMEEEFNKRKYAGEDTAGGASGSAGSSQKRKKSHFSSFVLRFLPYLIAIPICAYAFWDGYRDTHTKRPGQGYYVFRNTYDEGSVWDDLYYYLDSCWYYFDDEYDDWYVDSDFDYSYDDVDDYYMGSYYSSLDGYYDGEAWDFDDTSYYQNYVESKDKDDNYYDDDDDEVFIGRDLAHTRGYGEGVATAIDQEVKRIIDECYAKARQIITENRSVLDACAKLLLEKEKISQKEFEALFETDHVVL